MPESCSAGSRTSESKRMPPFMKNQCSARWVEAPRTIHASSAASSSSPRTSRPGPSFAAVQRERPLSYIAKPSWCSATGTTYCAPALFRRAGAQYVVPVAEHHDGFAMYDSGRSRWTAAKLGPGRDVLGELLDAADEAWMVRGASTHRAEHWFFMNGGMRFDSDVRDPALQDFYGPAQREETAPNERFLEDWLLRCVEIVDRYRPQVVYFDWWIEQPAFEPYLRTFAAYYYNRAAEWGREVVIHYKWDAFAPGSAVYDVERGTVSGIREELWQNDTSVSRSSWCWVEDHMYKRSRDIVAELADVVARNGVLQLNVGPKPDGTIPDEERRILEDLGAWLVRNGEAIYGTRPWTVAAEGPTRVAAGSFTDGAPTDFGPTAVS